MSEPIDVDPARLLEFVSRRGPVVVFLAFHPAHRFNRALPRHLRAPDGSSVPCGRVGLVELVMEGGPAFGYLRQGLRERGVSLRFDVLPGYYLFADGQLLAWDSGLAAKADVRPIVGASLLGFLAYALTRDVLLIATALRLGAEEAAAARMGARFFAVASEPRTAPRSPPPPDPVTELMNAYRLLGVDPSASDREIHRAWRRLQAELHPDRAMHDPEELARRNRLVTELNRARDLIRAHRDGGRGHERRASSAA